MNKIRNSKGQFTLGHYPLPNAGFKKNNQFGKNNIGNTYGKINKGRKAPWAKPPHLNGSKNPKWKGGIMIDQNGYMAFLRRDHPFAPVTGYVKRHKLIAELCLERYLLKREIIHHINENTKDDRPENLYLFLDSAGHSAYHCLLKYVPELLKIISVSNLPNPNPEAKVKIHDLLTIQQIHP